MSSRPVPLHEKTETSPEIPALPSLTVDEVGLVERAQELGKRSLKKDGKLLGLKLAMSMVDLTTLEGADTPGRVERLCRRAIEPAPTSAGTDAPLPPVAAVCVYPRLVKVARRALEGSPVAVCAVASGFPAGQVPLEVKIADTEVAVAEGADEVDIVIARGDFLQGELQRVHDEVARLKEAGGHALLKVILETGELGSFDQVARAAWIACTAGADFVKTSTGKVGVNATPATALCMLNVVRDYVRSTGRLVGVKVAGGIRTAKEALHYLVLVHETHGAARLHNRFFRIGASSLVNDLVRQWKKQATGRYVGVDDVITD